MRFFPHHPGSWPRHHHPGPHGHGRGRYGDEPGRGHHERRQGRGGRRRVFESAELRLVLLKLIADQPRHGYDLIRAIEDLTGSGYVPSPGVIYPTLTMLEDMGQIEKAKSEGARKPFTVTDDGIRQLETEKDAVEAMFARLAALATKRERTDGAPIRRAMENLRAVLMHRLGRDDVDTDTVHAAVSILDEAAQRIERLP
ncbi:PadR family transcriptional regulator [Azospirillum canadense]|uniref:PadR family transcriptional regulator n=1 Tax=Azospirillum canadense TaxID=403962 RepID=UPI002227210C|nr:PadR family transcriptional regulator [Azospirillum canadense]MCW2241980.1 DNA-binding PadR family transcriptional regulator [Azospirillum canadense]